MEDDDGRAYGINGKNALRYVNHCRQANAAFEDAELVARKTIQRGEEITHNYGDDWDSGPPQFVEKGVVHPLEHRLLSW